jgi:predicted nucleic acid-binding protein
LPANARQVVIHLHSQPRVGGAAECLLKPHGHFRRSANVGQTFALIQPVGRWVLPTASIGVLLD